MKPVARLIVLILIALLPLRGWSAVGMSVNMAATEMTRMASHEMSGHEAMPEDCPMMRMASTTDQNNPASDGNQTSENLHHGCQSCQLCMTLVAQDVPGISLPEPAPLSLALAPIWHYSSADISTDSKPPIS